MAKSWYCMLSYFSVYLFFFNLLLVFLLMVNTRPCHVSLWWIPVNDQSSRHIQTPSNPSPGLGAAPALKLPNSAHMIEMLNVKYCWRISGERLHFVLASVSSLQECGQNAPQLICPICTGLLTVRASKYLAALIGDHCISSISDKGLLGRDRCTFQHASLTHHK